MRQLHADNIQSVLREIRASFNNVPDVLNALRRLREENAAYKKQAEEDEAKRAAHLAGSLAEGAEMRGGIRVVVYTEAKRSPVLVRTIAGIMQKAEKNLAFVAAFQFEGKPNLILMYTPDLVAAGRNAGVDIRDAAKCIQGGGGGQPGLAMAGGKDASGLAEAMKLMLGKI